MTATAIHIPINRKRIKRLFILCISVGSSCIIASIGYAENSTPIIILRVSGVIVGLIFLLAAADLWKKQKDKNAGITINHDGITDRSSTISVGFIPWKDIKSIEYKLTDGVVLIKPTKNKDYLNRAKNKAVKKLFERNIELFATPILIESNYFDCDFNELRNQFELASTVYLKKKVKS